MPRSVKDPSGEFETIYVDGQVFRRDMPKPDPAKPKKAFGGINARPIGTTDDDFINRVIQGNSAKHRLKDLDEEGVWAEVIYPGPRHLGLQHPNPGSRSPGRARHERVRPQLPAEVAALRVLRHHPAARHRRCGRRNHPLLKRGLPHRVHADQAALRSPRIQRRRVGSDVGRVRGDRHAHRVPHRDRTARSHRADRHLLPRSAAAPFSTTSRRPTAGSAP